MTKLQKIMDEIKITDKELYKLSGVHFNVIKLIRTGRRLSPRFKTLKRLADVLGCMPKDIGG
ncbi:helix-turn-helix domain-containing protein [Gemella morbillorum]